MRAASEGGGLPVYPWKGAPPNLMTERQLRGRRRSTRGLDYVGMIILPRRKRPAYLYNFDESVPIRTMTPTANQLAALANANLERQIKAAERRGISRAELSVIGDPGPGWGTPDPAILSAALAVHARADAVYRTLIECGASEQVLAAVDQWRDATPTAEYAPIYLEDEPARREDLHAQLADLNLSDTETRPVEFALAYLDGHVQDLDLLRTPVLVDPAIAARGRVDTLLSKFAEHGAAFAPAVVNESTALTPADQRRVRAATHHALKGQPIQRLWPTHIDRDQLAASLRTLARTARTHPDAVQPVHAQVTALMAGEGLHRLERIRIGEFLADITAGRTPAASALLLDERSKQRLDIARCDQAGRDLAAHTTTQVESLLGQRYTRPLARTVTAISGDITWLSRGHHSDSALSERRQLHDQHLSRLNRGMRAEHLPPDVRTHVRAVLDIGIRTAGRYGRARTGRDQQWAQRIICPAATTAARLIAAANPPSQVRRRNEQPVPQPLPETLAPSASAASAEVAP